MPSCRPECEQRASLRKDRWESGRENGEVARWVAISSAPTPLIGLRVLLRWGLYMAMVVMTMIMIGLWQWWRLGWWWLGRWLISNPTIKSLVCCSTNIYILWVLGLRKSTVVIYDGIQGAIKNVLIEKNHNKNWVLWGWIFPWTWLRSAWSCLVLVKKGPKTFFLTQGVPVTGDITCAL